MAFADQQGMSTQRMMGLGFVALLHILLGYAFVTGLALKAIKKIVQPIEAVEVKDDVKPEEPPPPPPKLDEIPPYVPPPIVDVQVAAPPPPVQQVQRVAPPPPTITMAPPAPVGPTTPATPKGRLGATITTDDYPEASIRAEEEGVTKVQYEVGTDGRVTAGSCQITASSGHDRLDRRTCELVERRFRFNPAMREGTPVRAGRAQSVRWQIPKN